MTNKTVFVIGAGASKEANLPTGEELKKNISKILDIKFNHSGQYSGDVSVGTTITKHLRQQGKKENEIQKYIMECWHISEALPLAISIDNFIDQHRNNEIIEFCGKIAIVKSILDAERKSSLYYGQPKNDRNKLNYGAIQDSWYVSFFKLITENCRAEDLEERLKTIVLIVFNYDRCVEHFLVNAIQDYYEITLEESLEIFASLEIYHPYGIVGDLDHSQHNAGIRFGKEPTSEDLLNISSKIKTFTEGTDPDSSEIFKIKNYFNSANKMVFLGFAFHKLNMELIKPLNTLPRPYLRAFCTTFGLSDSDKIVIKEQLYIMSKNQFPVEMANSTCSDFFTEYWRSLAF